MQRSEAIHKLNNEQPMSKEQAETDLAYVLKKLEITPEEFEQIMSEKPKSFLDYPSYYSTIKRLRKPIRFLYKLVSPTTPLLLSEMSAKKWLLNYELQNM